MLHLKTFGGLSVDIDGTPATGALDQVRRAMGPAPWSMLATGTLVLMWVRQLEAA